MLLLRCDRRIPDELLAVAVSEPPVRAFEALLPALGVAGDSDTFLSTSSASASSSSAFCFPLCFGGFAPILLIFLPSTILAATFGVWLFYVQHQFEDTHWDREEEWDMHKAALEGSSHYDLPLILHWFSANIGIHHVHHLYSRIPFYRLQQIIKDYPALSENQRLSVYESFASVKLHLWDETDRKLISYKQLYQKYGES